MSEWSSESQIKSYEDIDEEKGKVHVEGKENTKHVAAESNACEADYVTDAYVSIISHWMESPLLNNVTLTLLKLQNLVSAFSLPKDKIC